MTIKTISYDDYLRLCGLLALAADHRKALEDIERAASGIMGTSTEEPGHISDCIWSEGYSAARLLSLLGFALPETPKATTTPEQIEQQMGTAMDIARRFNDP